MTSAGSASIHASAVLAGNRAVLIRGPSGSGKSRLAFDRALAGGYLPPTTLIGDDRVRLTVNGGTLTVRGVAELAGKIEIRGLGIRSVNYAADGPIGLVVDLNAADAARLPPPESLKTTLEGLELPRIPVGADFNALPLVLAFLTTT